MIFFFTLWKRTDLLTEQLNQNSRCSNTQKIKPAKCLLAMLSDTRKRLLRWIFIVQNYFILHCNTRYIYIQRHKNRTHIWLSKRFGIARFCISIQWCECKCYICLHAIYKKKFCVLPWQRPNLTKFCVQACFFFTLKLNRFGTAISILKNLALLSLAPMTQPIFRANELS